MRSRILNLHRTSLFRGSALVLVSLAAAYLLSGFPEIHPAPLLIVPAFVAIAGSADTFRCIRNARWDFFHFGVLLFLYMDLLAVCLILFLLFYPYMLWLTSGH